MIKLLPPAPSLGGGDDIARLSGTQRVSSSYVARVLDAGRHGEQLYVVREHIQGHSLAEVVTHDGPLDADALERVSVGVLTALTAVHLAGITHRGLTPHNVIMGPDGPRVTDIDLGEPVGEVSYRAPSRSTAWVTARTPTCSPGPPSWCSPRRGSRRSAPTRSRC